MPIGSTVVYNAGDLILSTVSSSGNTFQENKIAAATSSIILFNSNGLISSQSLSSTNVGTSSYFSGSTIIVSNLTASNISASNTGSFNIVGIGVTNPSQKLEVQGNGQFGNDSVTSVGLKLTRLIGGIRTSEHSFHSTNNSPWYTYGQNLNWTGELAGTVESTQAFRPYFEGFAPASGYKVFGFMDVTTGTFTSANVVNSLVIRNTGNVGIGITNPVNRFDVAGNISASVITASLFSGSVSGSVFGTSSWASNALSATSATTATTANALNTGNSYTIAGLTVNGNISSSGNISASVFVGAHTGSTFGTSSWSSNSVTASYLIPSNSYTISNLTASNISASGAVIASSFTGSFSGSISNATSASYALSSSFATTATTATTANALNTANNYQVTNLYATGNITASNVSASAISSSGLFASSGVVSGQLTVESGFTTNGSTILGNNQGNTVVINPASSTTINSPNIRLTGSVVLTGSLSVINISASSYMSASVFVGAHTGSTFGTSSWASNVVSALTASYLSTANSYQITNLTASNISASGAVIASSFTGSFSGSISNSTSASYALSSSFATTAATANALNTANTYTVSGFNINTGNLTMGSATEILLSDGDQTAPGLAFSADTNTGIYRVANDTIGFTTNGTLKLDINSNDISSSIPISASLFVGPVTGSVFGTSSWASNVISALTASYLTPANSYQITNLTASNISASATGSFNILGIGTVSPSSVLEVSNTTATTLFHVKGVGGASVLAVSGSGNIGVGTSPSTTYKMQISGSFSATTKSFDIEHPTKSGKRLVYGSLESPYHGVRLTGKGKLIKGKGIIQLPDYMNSLVDYETANIQITNIKHNKVVYVDDFDEKNNSINVAAKIPKTQLNKELEFYWTFTAIRKDVPNLQVEL